MTWISKAVGLWGTVLLLGFILQVLSLHPTRTLYMCQRDCKNETDNHVCSMKMFRTDDNKPFPVYEFLRNECERKCFMAGDYEKVEMARCTEDGQNHTTYLCSEHKMSRKMFQRCMRNESLDEDYD